MLKMKSVARGGALALSMIALASCATQPAEGPRTFPTLGRSAAGILVDTTGSRAILPAGTPLRPVIPPGVDLVKVSELFVPNLYNDPAGYCTIGYGHLIKRSNCDGTESPEFLAGLTPEAGELLLVEDMTPAQIAVMMHVSVELTDEQFAALTDFVFNVGEGNFQASTLLRRINEGNHDAVPTQLRRWVFAGGEEFEGLRVRREREINLYTNGVGSRDVPSMSEDTSPIDIRVGERR
ncbi:MAG: lysozyme [Hyphomonadaceae bacterium]|nr:lysozyme [Hyphomonadaceae bacterium]